MIHKKVNLSIYLNLLEFVQQYLLFSEYKYYTILLNLSLNILIFFDTTVMRFLIFWIVRSYRHVGIQLISVC